MSYMYNENLIAVRLIVPWGWNILQYFILYANPRRTLIAAQFSCEAAMPYSLCQQNLISCV